MLQSRRKGRSKTSKKEISEKEIKIIGLAKTAFTKALAECDELGIAGKDITPFLLGRIKDVTGGDSLKTNIELVYNNARVGAEIAVEYSKL